MSDFDDGASMISSMTSPPPPPPPATDVVTVRKDPKFVLYVRMLNMGVPLPAVQMKMKSEGLNPDAVLYVALAAWLRTEQTTTTMALIFRLGLPAWRTQAGQSGPAVLRICWRRRQLERPRAGPGRRL